MPDPRPAIIAYLKTDPDFARFFELLELTDRELGEATDLDHSTVSRWRSGARKPNPDNLAKLSQKLGVPGWVIEISLTLVRKD